jgi:SH3-like domain-containing protein
MIVRSTRIAALAAASLMLSPAGARLSAWADSKAPATAAATSAPAAAAPATTPKPAKPPYNPNIGSASGLPLPRFVALRADAVNLRVGPGDQYPILWVYHRVGLPVEILREYDVWRLVIDSDGTKGWMHEATLVGTRHFVINGTQPVTLYRHPTDGANPAAQLMPGVVGLIEKCDPATDWCRVRVSHTGGWLKRTDFWGVLPGEKLPAK